VYFYWHVEGRLWCLRRTPCPRRLPLLGRDLPPASWVCALGHTASWRGIEAPGREPSAVRVARRHGDVDSAQAPSGRRTSFQEPSSSSSRSLRTTTDYTQRSVTLINTTQTILKTAKNVKKTRGKY